MSFPGGIDPSTGLPPGVRAEANGEPVRRVVCNGNPVTGVEEFCELRGVADHQHMSVLSDAFLHGDGWVYVATGKWCPSDEVVVHREADG